jgi:hypothetical protein
MKIVSQILAATLAVTFAAFSGVASAKTAYFHDSGDESSPYYEYSSGFLPLFDDEDPSIIVGSIHYELGPSIWLYTVDFIDSDVFAAYQAGEVWLTASTDSWGGRTLYDGFLGQPVGGGGFIGVNSFTSIDSMPLHHAVISYNTTAVPEPETYAMLLAGLGIVGAVARRRRHLTHR